MQSWVDSTGTFLHPRATPNPFNHPGYDPNSPKPSVEYIKSVIDRLNPVDVHLDHYYLHDQRFGDIANKYIKFKDPNPTHRPKGTISLNWARYASISMKRNYEQVNQFKYDYVLVTRYDNQHIAPLILENFNPNILAVPNVHQVDDLIGDTCNLGGSDIVDIWSEQINGIDKLVEAGTLSLSPHAWMRAWLDYNNISWEYRGDLGVWTDR